MMERFTDFLTGLTEMATLLWAFFVVGMQFLNNLIFGGGFERLLSAWLGTA